MTTSTAAKPSLKPKDAPELGRFVWDDALLLETQLTEDERMLRDAARQFAHLDILRVGRLAVSKHPLTVRTLVLVQRLRDHRTGE